MKTEVSVEAVEHENIKGQKTKWLRISKKGKEEILMRIGEATFAAVNELGEPDRQQELPLENVNNTKPPVKTGK